MEAEFGRVAQAGELVGCCLAVGDEEFSGTELVGFLTGAVGHQYGEMRWVVVKYLNDQRGPRLRPRLNSIFSGKLHQTISPASGVGHQCFPMPQNKLDLTDVALP